MEESYDIEIAEKLPLPDGYVLGALIPHAKWLGRHVVRECDDRACLARCRDDLATQVTSVELDAAIARARGRIGSERETQSALELEGLDDLDIEWQPGGAS